MTPPPPATRQMSPVDPPNTEPPPPPLHYQSRSQSQSPSVPHPSRSSASLTPSLPNESARGRTLTYEDLTRCFHLPINDAARELGVCVTALKKQCRKHGVQRWPHRKLKSLDKLQERLEKEKATAADKEYYKHEIHSIVQKKDHIFRAAPAVRDSTRQDRPNSSQPLAPDPRLSSCIPHAIISTDHPPIHGQALVMQRPQNLPPQPPIAPPAMGALPIPPQHLSLCGIMGCDCYVNGGVSSQNYHMPIPTRPGTLPAANSALIPSNPSQNPSQPPQSAHFYGTTTPYPYPTHLSYPAAVPFHNMVQVNVLEQQPYAPHPATIPPTSQGQMISAPHGAPVGTTSAVGNSPNLVQPAHVPPQSPARSGPQPSAQPPAGYEVYTASGTAGSAQPPNGFVYGSFAAQGQNHFEGVIQTPNTNGSNGTMVSPYWTDMQAAGNPNNLVTMYNQTTHHHHHHAAESAGNANSTAVGMVEGTASSATNNSDVGDSRRMIARRPKDTSLADAGTTVTASRAFGMGAQSGKRNGVTAEDGGLKSTPINGVVGNNVKKGTKTPAIRNGTTSAKSPIRPASGGRNEKKESTTQKVGNEAGQDDTHKDKQDAVNEKGADGPAVVTRETPESEVDRNAEAEKTDAAKTADGRKDMERAHEKKLKTIDAEEGSMERDSGDMEDMRKASGRTANKRPRISTSECLANGWGQSYIAARTTGVAEILHGVRQREITPPSDREETPDDQDLGTGSGSGSGTGDGIGSGSGSGSRDGEDIDSERSKDEATGVGRKRGRDKSGRHGVDGLKWCRGGSREEGGGATQSARARRYEFVVHNCVSLSCAQWCTDKNFVVTISVGSKALLGLVGVGSHGRSVFENVDSEMVESVARMRNRYCAVVKGQRQEWVATVGRKRYLVVLSPFRWRSGAEISGISGLLMELTQRCEIE